VAQQILRSILINLTNPAHLAELGTLARRQPACYNHRCKRARCFRVCHQGRERNSARFSRQAGLQLMLGAAKAVVLGACAPHPGAPAHGSTIASSFAALQSTINAATAPATVLVTPGSYTLGATITPKTGVWIKGDGVTINPNGLMVFDLRHTQSDVWISGFTINGASTDGLSGLVNINNYSYDIHIVNNRFLNFGAAMWIWAGNNIYVQGNLFQNGSQAISSRLNGGSIDTQVISDNEFINNTRFAIETGHFGTAQTNFHCDRNLIHGTGDLGLSIN
jgi:hypothetical protein